MRLHVTIASGPYDRVRAIMEDRIRPEGTNATYLALAPEECFWRMNRFAEFDVSEFSMSNYITEHCSGHSRFVAIPVFLSRMFRHSHIFVNAASGIESPKDLVGRRVGVPEYAMTALVWIRGMLKDDYGVTPEEIRWFTGGMEQPGRKEKAKLSLPETLSIGEIPPGRTLNEMLVEGTLDALMVARPPSAFLAGSPAVRRLFPNYAELEADYFRRTRIFPIMHTVVVRRELYASHRWIARALFKAFEAAKEECLNSLRNAAALPVTLPWVAWEVERTESIFGTRDLWPYGVEANRAVLETLVGYVHDQHLAARRPAVEELFAPETLEAHKV